MNHRPQILTEPSRETPILAGMGNSAGVTNFCGLRAKVHGQIRQVLHGCCRSGWTTCDVLGMFICATSLCATSRLELAAQDPVA